MNWFKSHETSMGELGIVEAALIQTFGTDDKTNWLIQECNEEDHITLFLSRQRGEIAWKIVVEKHWDCSDDEEKYDYDKKRTMRQHRKTCKEMVQQMRDNPMSFIGWKDASEE